MVRDGEKPLPPRPNIHTDIFIGLEIFRQKDGQNRAPNESLIIEVRGKISNTFMRAPG